MFKMKKATYGSKRTIEYNENAPCILCGKPVIEVSMAGPTICPWCDSGCPRLEAAIIMNQKFLAKRE